MEVVVFSSLKFGNSFNIAAMDKYHQDKCCMDKWPPAIWHLIEMATET